MTKTNTPQVASPVEALAERVADLTARLEMAQAKMEGHDFEPQQLKVAHVALPATQQAIQHSAFRQATFAANKAFNEALIERDRIQGNLADARHELRRAREAAARPPLPQARLVLEEAEERVRLLTAELAGFAARTRHAAETADVAELLAVDRRREELPHEQYAVELALLKAREDVLLLEAAELAEVPAEMTDALTEAEARAAEAQEALNVARRAVTGRRITATDLRARAGEARRSRVLMIEQKSRPLGPVVRSLRHATS